MRPTRKLAGTDIDWQPVHDRLAATAVALEESFKPSPEHARYILEERAHRLAQPLQDADAVGAAMDVLSLTLAGERYAIETRYVHEVLRHADLAHIPNTPDFVAGVTNLRGEILAVFDLHQFFGRKSSEAAEGATLIVCGEARAEFGILADSVHEVTSLSTAELLADPVFENSPERHCIRGVTRAATIVLDGSALLNDQRLFIDLAHDTETTTMERGA